MSEFGFCECGCGGKTRIITINDKSKGYVKGQPLRFIHPHGVAHQARKLAAARLGNKNLSTHGYVLVTLGKRRRQYEHILIAEKALGRKLKKISVGHPLNEVVHHIDGDKTNNNPNNLLICTHRYHTELHRKLENSSEWPEFPKIIKNHGGKNERV